MDQKILEVDFKELTKCVLSSGDMKVSGAEFQYIFAYFLSVAKEFRELLECDRNVALGFIEKVEYFLGSMKKESANQLLNYKQEANNEAIETVKKLRTTNNLIVVKTSIASNYLPYLKQSVSTYKMPLRVIALIYYYFFDVGINEGVTEFNNSLIASKYGWESTGSSGRKLQFHYNKVIDPRERRKATHQNIKDLRTVEKYMEQWPEIRANVSDDLDKILDKK